MKPRFETKGLGDRAWTVIDNEAIKWGMPANAITMNVRIDAATTIATILNQEWTAFNRNPS